MEEADAIGAVWYLYLLGYNMSIAVWVGLIALMGVDAETCVFMLFTSFLLELIVYPAIYEIWKWHSEVKLSLSSDPAVDA